MLAKDFMTKEVITANEDTTVKEAAEIMYKNNISCLPVINESNKLVGLITESDFVGKSIDVPHAMASIKKILGETFYNQDIESVYAKSKKHTLKEVMSKNLHTVSPDHTLSEVVNYMIEKNYKRMPVLEDGKLVGIITRKDILHAFNDSK